MSTAFIALGANVAGQYATPLDAVEAALRRLDGDDMTFVARSRLYRSTAWPNPADPEFINAVASVQTDLPAAALLCRLHAIEAEFGRVRLQPNAPRTLDLDIVDYDGLVSVAGDRPVLPHPRMADRAFVLLPLRDVAPNWRHPVTGTAIGDLIAALAVTSSATAIAL